MRDGYWHGACSRSAKDEAKNISGEDPYIEKPHMYGELDVGYA